MRLNLFFIVMYLLTVLAYPIVFVHSKIRQFLNSRENVPLADVVVAIPATPVR